MRAIRVMRFMRTTTLARCVLVMLAMSAGTVRRGELRHGNGWPVYPGSWTNEDHRCFGNSFISASNYIGKFYKVLGTLQSAQGAWRMAWNSAVSSELFLKISDHVPHMAAWSSVGLLLTTWTSRTSSCAWEFWRYTWVQRICQVRATWKTWTCHRESIVQW